MLLSDDGRFYVHALPSSYGPDTEALKRTVNRAILNIQERLVVVLTSKSSPPQNDALYSGKLGIVFALRETGDPSWRHHFNLLSFNTRAGMGTMLQSDMYAAIV